MSIVNVDCEDLWDNPKCAHGPTLKFSRLVKGKLKTFFACSAYRDRKNCPFFLLEGEAISKSKQLVLDEWKKQNFPSFDHSYLLQRFKKVVEEKNKNFCSSCFEFVLRDEISKHNNHSIKKVTNSELMYPTRFLNPLTKNKSEAQYWFNDKTLKFLETNIKELNVDKVLCIGTPTVYETLKVKNIEVVLLDIDHRYHWFLSKQEFIWFNMFNFYFMDESESNESHLKSFLKDSSVVILIDPPFGARIEPLQKSITKFKEYTYKEISVYLILPYFMEPQVLASFPDFSMLDFPVEYTNHKKFKENHCSPVRLFTNVDPSRCIFPSNENYHFCSICKAWRSKLNIHCDLCNICPSKNGDCYKHCSSCGICVKQTWNHCKICNRCALPDHNCERKMKVTATAHFPRKKRKGNGVKFKC